MVVVPGLECKGVNYTNRDPKASSVSGGGGVASADHRGGGEPKHPREKEDTGGVGILSRTVGVGILSGRGPAVRLRCIWDSEVNLTGQHLLQFALGQSALGTSSSRACPRMPLSVKGETVMTDLVFSAQKPPRAPPKLLLLPFPFIILCSSPQRK